MYFHRPFAPFNLLRGARPGFKVVAIVRNPIARACSRFSPDHRGLSNEKESPEREFMGDLARVRNYRSCRAWHLERRLCRMNKGPGEATKERSAVCSFFQTEEGISIVDRERKLVEALYFGTDDTVEGRSGNFTFSLKQVEAVEWELLWRCYKPMREVGHNVLPSLYSEHLKRWDAVLKRDSLQNDSRGGKDGDWILGGGRLLIVLQEDLLDHPDKTLANVVRFLGLEPMVQQRDGLVSASTSVVVNAVGPVNEALAAASRKARAKGR